ncbi:hypothetical protein GF322_05010 [Candidatus Dependentiae bacterium]|nr:hypothetical protein [Candidatus Dependentiae bacterium]
MKLKSFSYFLIVSIFFIFNNVVCNTENYKSNNLNCENELDTDALMMMKYELEKTKNVLVQIKNTQNPAFFSKISIAFVSLIKELLYITGATFLGGGFSVLGLIQATSSGMINDRIIHNPITIFIGLPSLIMSIIITYAILKKIFKSNSPDIVAQNIKEHLDFIDQTIKKLNYEIKKIERVIAVAKKNHIKRAL